MSEDIIICAVCALALKLGSALYHSRCRGSGCECTHDALRDILLTEVKP